MRKFIFLLAVFSLPFSPLSAQSHYYGIEGDTLTGMIPIYHYQWWPDFASWEGDTMYSVLDYNAYMLHTTDSALRIKGLSMVFEVRDEWGNIIDEVGTEQYLRLYQATPNGPVKKGEVCWTDGYKDRHPRYLKLRIQRPENPLSSTPCDSIISFDTVYPILEYYFDSAITVTDSFYVGGSHLPVLDLHVPYDLGYTDYPLYDSLFTVMTLFAQSHRYTQYAFQMLSFGNTTGCIAYIPEFHYASQQHEASELANDPRFDTTWHYGKAHKMTLVFPILDVDTVGMPYDTARFECGMPDSTVLDRRFYNAARIEWVAGYNNSEFQLSLTAPGGDPDSGQIFNTSSPGPITLTGLSPQTDYEIYIRAWCDYSQMWSAWTDPVYVGAFNGIDGPEGGPAFTLVPNPARGSVTLTLEGEAALPATVTVLDLQGRELRRETLRAATHALGLQGLPPATYILRLDTPQGSSSRKLTVE